MRWVWVFIALGLSAPAFAQNLQQQQQDDRALRGVVQSLSEAQKVLLSVPDLLAENKRLAAENQELHKKLDAIEQPPKPSAEK